MKGLCIGFLMCLASVGSIAAEYVGCHVKDSFGCTANNYFGVPVGTVPASGKWVIMKIDAGGFVWTQMPFTSTAAITLKECSGTIAVSGTCSGTFSFPVTTTLFQVGVTCTAPQVNVGGVCQACSQGNYYSAGACVAEPTCTAPQVLDAVNHVCITPDPVCVLPQVLENHVCVTPVPVCVLPQVLDNGVCVNPPGTVVCIPSPRTVLPCPSGYAPNSIPITSAETPDAYSSVFDALPLQDMIYGLGVAVCGLLGIGVGSRFV